MYRTKWQLAVFAALVPAFLSAPVASAAPTRTRTQTHTTMTHPTTTTHSATQHKAGQNSGNSTAALAALQQAHTLLAGANHDYDGYRAKAEHHITQAMHELGHQHGATGAGTTHKGGTAPANQGAAAPANKGAAVQGNANKEPQAQSDAQLKQALQLLSGLQGHLPNTHKAAAHVQSAITELNTALKIK